MIEILTRIKYPELYNRMVNSAKETASGAISFASMLDDGQPKLAESYNLLGSVSSGDVLLFVHDDVIFLSKGWDEKIRQAMELGFNLIGAVGSQEYFGGMIFDSGREYSAGSVAGIRHGKRIVKLMTHRTPIEPVKVVDGMFMAVDRKHFVDTGFDLQFDGLFYYDIDLCLRSNCAVVDILVSHEKPAHLYGSYPKDMRPMEAYTGAFNLKHGFKDAQIGDQRCDAVAIEEYAY